MECGINCLASVWKMFFNNDFGIGRSLSELTMNLAFYLNSGLIWKYINETPSVLI
jgi:hypothetical protein